MTDMADVRTWQYDVACFGTSPLMLSRAIDYARSGARVVLVDRGARPGGSWTTLRILGFENVEVGVHLIENRRGIREYLADASGVDMVIDCRNAGRLWGMPLPFPLSRVCLHGLATGKAMLRGRRESAALMARSAARAIAQFNAPFFYPGGGCGRLVSGLVEQVRAAGGSILLNTEVTSLTVDAEASAVYFNFSGDCRLRARRAIVSSRAHAPILPTHLPHLQCDTVAIVNAVIHFAGAWVRPTGYVELIGDPVIKRVRDVGTFSIPAPPKGEGLITIQLRNRDLNSACIGAQALLKNLVRRRLIAPGSRVIGIKWHVERISTARSDSLECLSHACGDLIETMPSTDLAEELVNRLCIRDRKPVVFSSKSAFDD